MENTTLQQSSELTKIRDIKKLYDRFVLVQGNSEQQKLVESWLSFFEENLERGQGSDLQGRLGILPNSPIETIPFNDYPLGKRVITDNRERKDSPHQKNDALFATDVFSILSGLAELLFNKNYGVQELGGFKREPEESDWVIKWATHEGKISEIYLLTHSNQILKLIRTLRPLLADFYSNGARPPVGYITEKSLCVLVIQDVAPIITKLTDDYEEIKDDQGRIEVVQNKVIHFLTEEITAYQLITSYFNSSQAILELTTTRGRFTPFLAVKTSENELFFLSSFVEELWYLAKRDKIAQEIYQRFASTFSGFIEIIDEAVVEPDADAEQEGQKEEDTNPEGSGDEEAQNKQPTDRVVPPPVEPSPFSSRSLDTALLAKESAVVTTFFLYQHFASQGIPFDEAERLFGADIRQELQLILASYPDNQLAQLFLSRSSGSAAGALLGRKRLFEDLLNRLSSRPDLLDRASQLFGQYGLKTELQSFSFQGNLTSESVFKQQLDNFFRLSDPSSALPATLPTNAINRLDTIILSYGLNDFLSPQERAGHQDAIWFIENLDANKLAIIFFSQLPPDKALELIRGNEKQLIGILVSYAKARGAELILHTYTSETAQGFFNGVSAEDQKATTGTLTEFQKHFNFSSHPIGDIADEVTQSGGEKAAGVLVGSPRSKRRDYEEKLAKIFIPEWVALGAEGQKRVYELFGMMPKKAGADSLDYIFLFEFITLSRDQIRQLQEPPAHLPPFVTTARQIVFITDEQRAAVENMSALLVFQREELLRAQQLVQQYLVGLDQEVVSQALSSVGPNASYDDLSLQRLHQAEIGRLPGITNNEEISDSITGERRMGALRSGRRGAVGHQLSSRAGAAAKKRLAKVLGKKGIEQLTGMATSPWLTAAKWLMDQENRPLIGGALLGLGSAIYNMFTNSAALGGGIGGGLAGAGVGFWLGGPVGALIGGIAGMTLGAGGMAALFPKFGAATATTGAAAPSVLPYSVQTGLGAGATPWTAPPTNTATQGAGSSAAQQAAAQQAAAQQAAQQAAAQQAAATTAATAPAAATTATAQVALAKLLSGVGTATLAPIVFLFITIGASMYTLTLIQSAFLVSAPFDSRFTAPAQAQFFKCTSASIPKPTSANVIRSTDGKYAFPLDGSFAGGMSCPHWDKTWVTDIFTLPGEAPVDQEAHLPILAYTDATVYMVVTNDSLGGLYVILKGDDGRWYYYAHNCAIYVTPGQRVVAGEIISISDRTGINAAVTPEHLHFGIQDGGSEPTFYHGGNVCPAIEFNEKFTDPQLTVCKLAPDCVTRL